MDNIIQINNEGEHAYDIIFSDSFFHSVFFGSIHFDRIGDRFLCEIV